MPEMNSTSIAKFMIRHLDIADYDDDAVERMMLPYKNLSDNIHSSWWMWELNEPKYKKQKVIKYSFNDNNYIVWTITKMKSDNAWSDTDYTVYFDVELVNEDDNCNMRILYLGQIIKEIHHTLHDNSEACNLEIVADKADN